MRRRLRIRGCHDGAVQEQPTLTQTMRPAMSPEKMMMDCSTFRPLREAMSLYSTSWYLTMHSSRAFHSYSSLPKTLTVS